MYKGVLIPVGGNEDKGFRENGECNLDFVTIGILSRIVRESGGKDAFIKVITTASQVPVKVGQNYAEAFCKLGCTNVSILDIRSRDDAEDSETVNHIREADCIMMSGGNQSRIVDLLGGTLSHDVMLKRFENERIIIAGTSAGAMAMSTAMISGGSSKEALLKGSVSMRDGMNFIPSLIIDSHFIRRGRFGRLAEAVSRYPHLLGIGLSEDTGLIIEKGNEIKVIGSGMAIVFDGSSLLHNHQNILPEGMPMTMTNLRVHVLANSDCLLVDEKRIIVLPIEAEFE